MHVTDCLRANQDEVFHKDGCQHWFKLILNDLGRNHSEAVIITHRTCPSLRSADELNENKKAILDAAWGFYVAGDVSFPVSVSVTRFHPKKIGTLRVLAKSSGHESIYQIAKMTGRDYRRVYDDIMDFVADGIAVVATEIRNGRKSKVARMHELHIA